MNCSQRRDLMPEYLLGLLTAEEAAALTQHLASGCPSCLAARSEAEAMLALLPEALPTRPAPAVVRERVMARIAAQAQSADARPRLVEDTETPSSNIIRADALFWRRLSWVAILVCGVLLVSNLGTHQRLQEKNTKVSELSNRLDSLQHQMLTLNEQVTATQESMRDYKTRYQGLSQALASATSTIDMLRSQNLVLVSLVAPGQNTSGPRARALWDKDTQHWQLIATGLKQPLNHRLYELWFITADHQKVGAGTFNVDAAGQAVMTVSVPHDIGIISVAAVTDEPGLMRQPTGAIALAGTL